MVDKLEAKLKDIVLDTELIEYLKAIKQVQIPNGWLLAGAVRNTVWKYLYPNCDLKVNDIDIAFFDKDKPLEMNEEYRKKLAKIVSHVEWEVDNQAWVHSDAYSQYHMPNAPYHSLAESMTDFWFTVNTIGIRLNENNEIEILNSQALPDLFNGILRVMEFQKDNHEKWFEEKIEKIISRCPEIKVIR